LKNDPIHSPGQKVLRKDAKRHNQKRRFFIELRIVIPQPDDLRDERLFLEGPNRDPDPPPFSSAGPVQ